MIEYDLYQFNDNNYKIMNKLKNIALYGGAFDPPHIGHLFIIE